MFQDAWNEFTTLLTAEERNEFHETRVEDVRRAVFNLQRDQERKKSLINCSRLNNFLQGMSTIVKISSARFPKDSYAAYILASHFAETFDALLSAYEDIGEKLTFLSANEKVFTQYPLMQRIIGWVYADLLEFHIKAQQFFRHRGWKQVFKANWGNFDTRFQGILVNFQRQKDLVESLARYTVTSSSVDIYSIMEKLNTYALKRGKLRVELDSKEKEEKDKKYWRVIEWLACLRPTEGEDKTAQEHVADHEFFCNVRKCNPGSGDWIIQNEMMASWMDDETPRYPVLWLNGIPGAECERKKGFKTSYFYCKESDTQKSDALSILQGLLVQLVTQEPTMIPHFFMKARSSGQVTLIAHQLAQNLIKISCKRILNQFIIIDGLDECPKEERRILLSFLAEVVDEAEDDEPGKLRVLIVSQDEADIAETLSKESRARPNFSVGQFAIRPKDNIKEIEDFVGMWTDQIGRKFRLSFDEVKCIERLTSSRTNGMFLYAKLVLENLFNQTNKNDVVTELDEHRFPDGIAAASSVVLRDNGKITHLLGWMICAKRPLKHYEIQCAFCLELTDSNETLHDVESRGLVAKVTELCGTLVRELPGERLELVHGTARIYLTKTQYISKPDVECKLASLCLRYLTMDLFDPDLEKTKINQYTLDGWLSLQDYVVSKWFQHLAALAKIYNEEGFKVEDSLAALNSLYGSMFRFLDRYADDISDEPVHDDVRDDYNKLASHEVYEDITRIISHVTRHIEKGPNFRNEICLQSLKKAFGRNRELIKKFSMESSRNSATKGALVGYYGHKRFKCSFVTCPDFYEGFDSAKTRDKHIDRHNRPWVCHVPHCTSISFGFSSNYELEKHMRDYHPDKSDLSALFKLTPKKVIESSKHVCHICGKSFSRNFHKMSHIRSHNGEKPFECTECGKAFTRDNDRKRHEKNHSRRQ
ncbi:hypothetical protein P152DRAFT_493542 [Eremomyces bilateralis CBS 781.70]|uniref:C2H2-type domain-containing protein n=1 Tax=Eremomyces bilateralis CBS 781.70 TaxID=1392243 RepID=A0A6G1FVQ4_9PEZI|nr:uncharacterized protein P152DRAFT_493542 [Eremomyces bilateralis CBS 781.70]KAF1809853.1 hypothetical protein P152DRAFT_493542 [Eremomyces bilateralis CBS 781.70]